MRPAALALALARLVLLCTCTLRPPLQPLSQHNVVGRTTYAEGTVDACLFLARQMQQGAPQKLYNMVDVLRAGSMR